MEPGKAGEAKIKSGWNQVIANWFHRVCSWQRFTFQSSACPYTTVQGQVCFPVRYWKWNHSPVLVIPDDNDANSNIPRFGCSSNFITLELDVCLDRPAIEGSISTPMTVHQMAKKYSIWLGYQNPAQQLDVDVKPGSQVFDPFHSHEPSKVNRCRTNSFADVLLLHERLAKQWWWCWMWEAQRRVMDMGAWVYDG